MRRVLSSCSLSLEAVKHGHTIFISAVGVEPCTGRLYFSGGGWGGGQMTSVRVWVFVGSWFRRVTCSSGVVFFEFGSRMSDKSAPQTPSRAAGSREDPILGVKVKDIFMC